MELGTEKKYCFELLWKWMENEWKKEEKYDCMYLCSCTIGCYVHLKSSHQKHVE